MAKHRKPLSRTMLIGGGLFVIVLCIALSVQGALTFTHTMFDRYNAMLTRILTHVEHEADADDLRRCVLTAIQSDNYNAFQRKLNVMVDDFELMYLYIVFPDVDNGLMINVISATNAAEFAEGAEDLPVLYTTDSYTVEDLQRYAAAMQADGPTFFFENSAWGNCYTACMPLRDTAGETFAVICADIPTDNVRNSVRSYVVRSVAITVLVGALFSVLMMIWVRRNVTGPVSQLESSARGFAAKSHGLKNPHMLTFDAPEIHTGNELESLSDAIAKMADDMRSYMEGILSAEQRATVAEKDAYQDALTHVKSKAAFNGKMSELNEKIETSGAQFALVVADLDDLKGINDSFGHEHGDDYIIGSCKILARVYKHSPLYRVGGDEFVAVLQGEDYMNREALLETAKAEFSRARSDTERQPWDRYSASVGLAVYSGAAGQTAEDVLSLADEDMYRRKRQCKDENAPQA